MASAIKKVVGLKNDEAKTIKKKKREGTKPEGSSGTPPPSPFMGTRRHGYIADTKGGEVIIAGFKIGVEGAGYFLFRKNYLGDRGKGSV